MKKYFLTEQEMILNQILVHQAEEQLQAAPYENEKNKSNNRGALRDIISQINNIFFV